MFEFDNVMGVIINAPALLNIEFAISGSAAAVKDVAAEGGEEETPADPSHEVGQTVTITVQQPESNKPGI